MGWPPQWWWALRLSDSFHVLPEKPKTNTYREGGKSGFMRACETWRRDLTSRNVLLELKHCVPTWHNVATVCDYFH